MQYKFPEGFWWGSATSGPQSEGAADADGRKSSIWDQWYKEEPNRFFDGVGPENTSNFYYQYKEDIDLMKQIGHNSFRTSIQWSRLIPDGTGEVNQKAVDFYNDVINGLVEAGVEPFINLYHFDMPMCMQEKGGWESREVVEAYVNYAKVCFELFGDRVKYWFTFNEPIVPVEAGYMYSSHYPCVVDFKRAVQVAHNSLIAHAKAIEIFRKMKIKGEIGVILNLTPSYPRSDIPQDLKAARIAELFFNKSFLDPVTKGKYPQELVDILRDRDLLPIVEDGDLKLLEDNIVDILGVNYYFPRRIKVRENAVNPEAPFMPEHLFDSYEMRGAKMNRHRGWEIYEKAVYDILIDIRDNYDNIPVFISENGMGVEGEEKFRNEKGYLEDDYRIDFIKDHLRWAHKAIEEGANCKGYHLWTFVDCWSWPNAYKNRYGFIELDLEDNYKRVIKKSGYWIKEVSENNGFSD